jgi:hypothetical protein
MARKLSTLAGALLCARARLGIAEPMVKLTRSAPPDFRRARRERVVTVPMAAY